MSDRDKERHHPLPEDERARHDLIPESIEAARQKGDDAPDDASNDPPASRTFRNPDGTRYPG